MEKTTTGALARPRKLIPINREEEAKKLEVTINERRLGRVALKDTYGVGYHLLDSSSAKQDALWLTIQQGSSLHLDKFNAIDLVALLNRFIENGTIK